MKAASSLLASAFAAVTPALQLWDDTDSSVVGLRKLAQRQLPDLADQIDFVLEPADIERYTVSQDPQSHRITVNGTSLSSIARGLYDYLQEYGHVSISWTHSSLPYLTELPSLCTDVSNCSVLSGSTAYKYRYHFNTCTFGYTTAAYDFDQWQHLLDWASLQGVNFPLAWTGYEQVLIDTLQEFGFSEDELASFVSSQDFLPWNRFGNVQGTWNGTLDRGAAQAQVELQKQILSQIEALGMTPILPAFTGFVPSTFKDHYPNATLVTASNWNGFPSGVNTDDTFLDPTDPLFAEIQHKFLTVQQQTFGHTTHYYTLDQYNELTPNSGDIDYLKNVSSSTFNSLRAVDPDAVWVMQGWLFYNEKAFWSPDRVQAYLSAPQPGEMVLLDLYSDAFPQWQRTESYFGHDWVWCELHDFGGNMGLEGSLQILTENSTDAKASSKSLAGLGLTMEGQEGNQISYDLLLAQAWDSQAVDISTYTEKFVRARYGPADLPRQVVDIWSQLVDLVYLNDPTASGITATTRSLFCQRPAMYGLLVPGSQSTEVTYNTTVFEDLWKQLATLYTQNAAWDSNPHFHHDMVDITRQMLANRFAQYYNDYVTGYNSTTPSSESLKSAGTSMLQTLQTIDDVLYTDPDFLLATWLSDNRNLARGNDTVADANEFQARNQITWWGPQAQINDYAAKDWAGLVGTYYYGRWERFINLTTEYTGDRANFAAINQQFKGQVEPFELEWQNAKFGSNSADSWTAKGSLVSLLNQLLG